MVRQELLSKEQAICQMKPELIEDLLVPQFSPHLPEDPLAVGIPSSPGVVNGRIAFDHSQIKEIVAKGLPAILVQDGISADDLPIIPLISGIVTRLGTSTSHAAVVARGFDIPCVVGCSDLEIHKARDRLYTSSGVLYAGDDILLDGTRGRILKGERSIGTLSDTKQRELESLLAWADEIRQLRIHATASTPSMIEMACRLGADAIGTYNTEPMLQKNPFLPLFQRAFCTETVPSSEAAWAKLSQLQRAEFHRVFLAADDFPITIRLFNTPMHELLPNRDTIVSELTVLHSTPRWAEEIDRNERLLKFIDNIKLKNPIWGVRGTRVRAELPQFLSSQVQSLFEGFCDATKNGATPHLRILIPFINSRGELEAAVQFLRSLAKKVMQKEKVEVDYETGATIETPRAALVADDLACIVNFLSIDCDSLTQTVFCCLREDSDRFLGSYLSRKDLASNPFLALDQKGVGQLVQLSAMRARAANSNVEIGVFGNLCRDLAAIELWQRWNINFVCCHPYDLPAVRLAAAQATIQSK